MRQRTISDFFWRDPEISDLSQEDKATLLYFLTSPSSNIIGAYQVVWMIAAAEMGWTKDQLLVVVKRLKAKGLIDFNDTGWVWVKTWWKHNSAKGAFSPKLLENAKKQCAAIPSEWRNDFVESLESVGINRVSIGYPYATQYPIDSLSIGHEYPTDTLSDPANSGGNTPPIPYSYPIDRVSHTVPHTPPPNTTIFNIQSTTTTTTTGDPEYDASPQSPKTVVVNVLIFPPGITPEQCSAIQTLLASSGVAPGHWQSILDEMHGAQLVVPIGNPVGYVRGIAKRASEGSFAPERGLAVANQREMRRNLERQDALRICAQHKTQPAEIQLEQLPDHLRKSLSRILASKAREATGA